MLKNQSGFTLVELLVGSFLLVVITLLVNNILFTVFKGTTKSEILKEVKQNGDYALLVMERMIRNAQEIVKNSDGETCTSSMSKLKIKNFDGGLTEFKIDGEKIASHSFQLAGERINYLTGATTSVTSLSFNCSQEAGKAAKVEIDFTLKQKGTAARKEEEAQVSFQTTVSLRNY